MISAADIDFSFQANRQVLHKVSADVRGGQFMAILGNNGVGKSTFMYCLNRILQPNGGRVQVGTQNSLRDIRDLKRGEIAREIAFVAQHSNANRLTVFDSVLLGRKPYINLAPTRHDLDIVDRAINRLGLEELSLRFVDELSGGEYQKVILARAIAQDTRLLLLDEPTNNLDPYNQYEVMRIVRGVVDQDGIAAVAVMHDLNLAVRFCDTFVFLRQGAVYAHGGPEIVTPKTLKDVYGIETDIINHKDNLVIITH